VCQGVLGVGEHGGVLGAATGATGGELLLAGALLCSGLWLTREPFLSGGPRLADTRMGRSWSRPRVCWAASTRWVAGPVEL
jgi:hypothetical protein